MTQKPCTITSKQHGVESFAKCKQCKSYRKRSNVYITYTFSPYSGWLKLSILMPKNLPDFLKHCNRINHETSSNFNAYTSFWFKTESIQRKILKDHTKRNFLSFSTKPFSEDNRNNICIMKKSRELNHGNGPVTNNAA